MSLRTPCWTISLLAAIAPILTLGACAHSPAPGRTADMGVAVTSEDVAVPPRAQQVGETSASPEPEAEHVTLEPFEDIRVHLHEPAVEIRAWVCIEAGFLEQIACSPGTREHESLVVVRAKPSNIHSSLLLAGFGSGSPGQWIFDPEAPEGEQIKLIPPRGESLEILVRYEHEGVEREDPIRKWVRDHHDPDRRLPKESWIFGGSLFRENPEFMGPGEHYVADMTGSIIGLVTFGDEVVGLRKVISDQAAIHEPEWEVDVERIPPFGTEVTLILRRAE